MSHDCGILYMRTWHSGMCVRIVSEVSERVLSEWVKFVGDISKSTSIKNIVEFLTGGDWLLKML